MFAMKLVSYLKSCVTRFLMVLDFVGNGRCSRALNWSAEAACWAASEAGVRVDQTITTHFCVIITSLLPVMTVIMASLLHIFTSLLHIYTCYYIIITSYYLNNGSFLPVITVIMDLLPQQ